jgi:DNA-binding MarR family transcriptional regulator
MREEPVQSAVVRPADDPTEVSRWRPVLRLFSDMDNEIAQVYADNGIDDLKPSWVIEIVRLHVRGPMTIADLARSVGRTHSALSQKVAAMRAAGWLDTSQGADARSKLVMLTPKAERVAGLLAAEWRATEAVITEIESELPYPLSRVADDIRAVLARKSFRDRITDHLAADGTRPGLRARPAYAAWARPRPSPAARIRTAAQVRQGRQPSAMRSISSREAACEPVP